MLEDLQRLFAIVGLQNLVAVLAEYVSQQPADAFFVFYQQNGFAPGGMRARGDRGIYRGRQESFARCGMQGRQMKNVAPQPGSLSTQISPPLSWTMR